MAHVQSTATAGRHDSELPITESDRARSTARSTRSAGSPPRRSIKAAARGWIRARA